MSTTKQAVTLPPGTRWSSPVWYLALVGVGLLALTLRWYYVTHAMVYHPIRGDAIQYHAYAWNLVQHGVFSMAAPDSPNVAPDSFRDPGYPLFLAGWMRVTGNFDAWYAAILLSQSLLGALTVVLLMSAARRWIRDGWLLGAGVLMALWPHSITITSFVLSETLFGFLVALAIWLWAYGLQRQNWRWAAAAGFAFGLAGLTNAVLLPFAPLLAVFLMLRRLITRQLGLALLVGALVLPAAWGIRNAMLPAGASSSGRALVNLVQGSWPDYHSGYRLAVAGNPEGTRIMKAIGREQTLMLADPAAGLRQIASRMGQAPLHYLGWYLSKPALLWGWSIRMGQGDVYVYPTAYSPFSENPAFRALISLCRAANPLLMCVSLFGLVVALRRGGGHVAGLSVSLLAVFVTLVYSILQSEPRYGIPFRGVELLLFAFALDRLAIFLTARRAAGQPTAPPA